MLMIRGLPPRTQEDKGRIELDVNKEWILFDEKDGPTNVATNINREIIGMKLLLFDLTSFLGLTLHKIVEKITNHLSPDKQLLAAVLATIHLYTSPMEFLELLILRYNVPLPKDKSDDSMEKYTNSFQAPIRLRVVSALKTWIAGFWHHFENDELLREKLLAFVNV